MAKIIAAPAFSQFFKFFTTRTHSDFALILKLTKRRKISLNVFSTIAPMNILKILFNLDVEFYWYQKKTVRVRIK